MAVAMTVRRYFKDHDIAFDTLKHRETPSASRTAQASHVPGGQVAKAVVLKRQDGYLLAVIPASRHLQMGELRKCIKEPVGLATETEVKQLFPDCDTGAVPALGNAYGLAMLVDESLEDQTDIYLEGGDHKTLVHITGEQFHKLVEDMPHGRFSAGD